MKVTVKLHGAAKSSSDVKAGQPLELTLSEGATAGDVLRELGGIIGEPFPSPTAGSGDTLHASLRVFVNGELSVRPDETPLSRDATTANVTVVVMSAVSGGA